MPSHPEQPAAARPRAVSGTRGTRSEFREICRTIAEYDVAEVPEPLLARRAVLWDWMNIDAAAPPIRFCLADVQAVLGTDEAIFFYYWMTSTSLLIATVERDRFAVERRSIDHGQRRSLETYASHALAGTRPNHGAFERVRTFGSFLLPDTYPIAWHTKRRLLISPHRVLHSIPFHAMQYENRWLIEYSAIAYIANLTSLQLPSAPPKPPRVLVAGVNDFAVSGKPLRPLPDAELEAREVAEIYEARARRASSGCARDGEPSAPVGTRRNTR